MVPTTRRRRRAALAVLWTATSTTTTLRASAADTLFKGAAVTELSEPPRHAEPWFVNFYSPWCGHCRDYAATWRAFADAATSDFHVGVVSCVAHKDVCDKEGVERWPTLKAYGALAENGNEEVVDARDLDDLVAFVQQRLPGVTLHVVPVTKKKKGSEKKTKKKDAERPQSKERRWTATPAVVRENAAASLRYAMATAVFSTTTSLDSERRQNLGTFLEAVAGATPELELAAKLRTSLQKEVTAEDWAASLEGPAEWTALCDPQKEGADGTAYTCGLWLLFHVLVDRAVAEGPVTPQKAMAAIRAFVSDFFACSYCRDHFLEAFDACEFQRPTCESTRGQQNEEDRTVLWLWRTHNAVNKRVHQGEVFPSSELCADCVSPKGDFDEAKVLVFLRHYYRPRPATEGAGRYFADDDDDDRKGGETRSLFDGAAKKALFLLCSLAALATFFYCRYGCCSSSSSHHHGGTTSRVADRGFWLSSPVSSSSSSGSRTTKKKKSSSKRPRVVFPK